MFVGGETRMQVSAAAAAARLVNLIGGSSLVQASHMAWGEGMARVGPAGPVPGMSKLVRVHFLPPEQRGVVTTVALRWEATGPGGRLFPVLDANVTLIPDGENATLLGLEGVYGPPGGAAGAGLDRVILHRLAAATIRSFLRRVSGEITAPAPGKAGHRTAMPGQLAPELP